MVPKQWSAGGTKPALLLVIQLIEELGPPLGIFINLTKCELFSCRCEQHSSGRDIGFSYAKLLSWLETVLIPDVKTGAKNI